MVVTRIWSGLLREEAACDGKTVHGRRVGRPGKQHKQMCECPGKRVVRFPAFSRPSEQTSQAGHRSSSSAETLASKLSQAKRL